MKGLLLKDYFIMKENLLTMVIALVVVGVGLTFLTSNDMTVLLGGQMFGQLALATITSDRESKWNYFAYTIPVSRRDLVKCKYIMYSFSVFLGIICGLCVSILLYIIKPVCDIDITITTGVIGIIFAIIVGAINISLSFFLPKNKAVLATVFSYIGVGTVGVLLIILIKKIKILEQHYNMLFIIVVVATILAYIISYIVTSVIYEKKKFL